jgi:hypothetical protein
MRKEKIILSFIAVAVGLIIAGVAYYFYQTSKIIPTNKQQTVTVKKPTPAPQGTLFLSVLEPADEKVLTEKVVAVSGKTLNDATIVIITENDQQVIKPTAVGNFATTVNIESGQNIIKITAFSKNGEQKTIERTVTYSTEDF